MNGAFARIEPHLSHLQRRTQTYPPPHCVHLHRKAPCVCLTTIKSNANGRGWPVEMMKWKKLVPWCVQVCRWPFLLLWSTDPKTRIRVNTWAVRVWVTYLPTTMCGALSLVSCADMWFVSLSVFMYKCSTGVDLCLNSQLLKVPHLVTCSFFSHKELLVLLINTTLQHMKITLVNAYVCFSVPPM